MNIVPTFRIEQKYGFSKPSVQDPSFKHKINDLSKWYLYFNMCVNFSNCIFQFYRYKSTVISDFKQI